MKKELELCSQYNYLKNLIETAQEADNFQPNLELSLACNHCCHCSKDCDIKSKTIEILSQQTIPLFSFKNL